MSTENKIGIEYKIFEYRGNQKKQIMDFRSAPGNLETGMKVMQEKLGISNNMDLATHIQNHTKKIIFGERG